MVVGDERSNESLFFRQDKIELNTMQAYECMYVCVSFRRVRTC